MILGDALSDPEARPEAHDDVSPADQAADEAVAPSEDDAPPPPREPTADELASRRELEAEARSTGWVPEAEWRGETPPPSGFKTADEWVRHPNHARQLARVQRQAVEEENRALRERLERLERVEQLSTRQRLEMDVRQVSARVDELKEDAFERGDWKRLKEIEAREKRAYNELRRRYEPLLRQEQQQAAAPSPDASVQPTEAQRREVEAWRAQNQDLDGDAVLRDALAARVHALSRDPAWRGRGTAMLDEAARQIRERFQAAPPNARPAHQPVVGTQTRHTMTEPRKTWRDMPQFNRDQYQMARRTGGYKNLSDEEFRKQAADEYWRERGDA